MASRTRQLARVRRAQAHAAPPVVKSPKPAKEDRQLCCSFCERTHREVRALIAGRRGYICDGCASAAAALVASIGCPSDG